LGGDVVGVGGAEQPADLLGADAAELGLPLLALGVAAGEKGPAAGAAPLLPPAEGGGAWRQRPHGSRARPACQRGAHGPAACGFCWKWAVTVVPQTKSMPRFIRRVWFQIA